MADITTVQDYLIVQPTTPTNPVWKLATKINATQTSITCNFEPKDTDGSSITKDFLIGMETNGYVETMLCTNVATTTLTVVRGIDLSGLDFAGTAALGTTHAGGDKVFTNISAPFLNMGLQAQLGVIGQTVKHAGLQTFLNEATQNDRTFADVAARDAALTSPVNGMCCLTIDTGLQFYNSGWLTLGTATPVTASLGVEKVGNDLRADLLSDGGLVLVGNELKVLPNFGDGSDGDVTISSNTTLSRDMYYNNLTINGGAVLKSNGYRIYVKGTYTSSETVSNTGGDGAGTLTSTLPRGLDGVVGSSGSAGGISRIIGTAGSAGSIGSDVKLRINTNTNTTNAGVSGIGGTGMIASGVAAGGNYGTAGTSISRYVLKKLEDGEDFISSYNNEATVSVPSSVNGGASGGAGGTGGEQNFAGVGGTGGTGGKGGDGGKSGGVIAIYARIINNTGTFDVSGSNGVNGSNGATGGNGVGNGNFAGGGGGGGGGAGGNGGNGGTIILVYETLTSLGTATLSAGTGGTGGSGGAGGLEDGGGTYPDGGVGGSGDVGETGISGNLFQLAL